MRKALRPYRPNTFWRSSPLKRLALLKTFSIVEEKVGKAYAALPSELSRLKVGVGLEPTACRLPVEVTLPCASTIDFACLCFWASASCSYLLSSSFIRTWRKYDDEEILSNCRSRSCSGRYAVRRLRKTVRYGRSHNRIRFHSGQQAHRFDSSDHIRHER